MWKKTCHNWSKMSASILRKQADALFITTWKYNTNGVQRLSVVYTSFVSFTNQYWTITSIQNKLTIVCVFLISLRVSDLYDYAGKLTRQKVNLQHYVIYNLLNQYDPLVSSFKFNVYAQMTLFYCLNTFFGIADCSIVFGFFFIAIAAFTYYYSIRCTLIIARKLNRRWLQIESPIRIQ